jgi:hypothetical protein
VQPLLGIVPLAPVQTLVVDPALPEWMPHVVLRGVRVGEARANLVFRRKADGTSDWDVEHLQGRLRVIRQPPPESIAAGAADRVWGLAESLVKS